MGLIRTAIKTLPYIAVFSLGYYFGSVKSDNYDCVFKNNSFVEDNNVFVDNDSKSLDFFVNSTVVEPYTVEGVVDNLVSIVDFYVDHYAVPIKDLLEYKINN